MLISKPSSPFVSDMTPASILVPRVDRDIWALQNHYRQNPKSLIAELEKILECFDGSTLIRPGKPDIETIEGKRAYREAIAFLQK